jgi:hypothetical protein
MKQDYVKEFAAVILIADAGIRKIKKIFTT